MKQLIDFFYSFWFFYTLYSVYLFFRESSEVSKMIECVKEINSIVKPKSYQEEFVEQYSNNLNKNMISMIFDNKEERRRIRKLLNDQINKSSNRGKTFFLLKLYFEFRI